MYRIIGIYLKTEQGNRVQHQKITQNGVEKSVAWISVSSDHHGQGSWAAAPALLLLWRLRQRPRPALPLSGSALLCSACQQESGQIEIENNVCNLVDCCHLEWHVDCTLARLKKPARGKTWTNSFLARQAKQWRTIFRRKSKLWATPRPRRRWRSRWRTS